MARIAPTVSTTLYSGVQGDKRVKHVKLAIAGTYAAASAAADGILLTPAIVGLNKIDYAEVAPSFTADTVEEYVTSIGPSTSTTAGWVFALSDKDDNLQSGNGAVTDITAFVTVVGY